MKIVTQFDYPPIPIRDMDYSAYDDDRLDGTGTQHIGRGRTRDAAILDLVAQACDDYTDEELAAADVQALETGDTTTLVFVSLMRGVTV